MPTIKLELDEGEIKGIITKYVNETYPFAKNKLVRVVAGYHTGSGGINRWSAEVIIDELATHGGKD